MSLNQKWYSELRSQSPPLKGGDRTLLLWLIYLTVMNRPEEVSRQWYRHVWFSRRGRQVKTVMREASLTDSV